MSSSGGVLFKHSDLDEDKGQAIIRNMKSNIIKKKAEQAAQTEFLHRQLSSLDGTKKKAETRIVKRIKEVKENAEYLEKEQKRINRIRDNGENRDKLEGKELSSTSFVFSLKSSGKPGYNRRSNKENVTPVSILKENTEFGKFGSSNCRFDQQKDVCKSFPCAPCSTYTNLGFFLNDDRMSVQSVTRGLSARSKSKLWHEVEASSVLKPLRVPYNKSIKQENALRKNIKHMREKNYQSKPKDWSIRYGEGTPLRKILKPVYL